MVAHLPTGQMEVLIDTSLRCAYKSELLFKSIFRAPVSTDYAMLFGDETDENGQFQITKALDLCRGTGISIVHKPEQ